ncbi:MAG TPA: Mov34/MPN/PAD-1 family protein [Thermoanaerobaculia bacterium]|nr:Mov34/MPN/PAD-1 family protein [Thermoanaerobaculia bacterium]
MFAWVLLALLASSQAQAWYEELLVDGGYGRLPHERAAFLILERDGSLTMQPWDTRGVRHATFRGAIPPRVLAIVHTHPRGEWKPSARDREEAVRTGIPVIVVTNGRVMAAMPNGIVQQLP